MQFNAEKNLEKELHTKVLFPIKKTKEYIFDWLSHDLNNKNFADFVFQLTYTVNPT